MTTIERLQRESKINLYRLAEAIVHRMDCGMGIGEASRDVFQWFGAQLSIEEKIAIECHAGRIVCSGIA